MLVNIDVLLSLCRKAEAVTRARRLLALGALSAGSAMTWVEPDRMLESELHAGVDVHAVLLRRCGPSFDGARRHDGASWVQGLLWYAKC